MHAFVHIIAHREKCTRGSYLLEEERVVYKHAIHALLEAVEEANLGSGLAEIDFSLKFSVPGVEVLVITGGDGHDAVACFGKRPRQSIAHSAKAACD